jgi:ADP-heptose:LPS heptosyltransferase
MKIWGVRGGMIGDSVMALPILEALENLFPNSYKYWVLHKRFSQAGQFYFNHPLIDKIHITEHHEDIGPKDIEIIKSCDLRLNIKPNHPEPDDSWYHHFNCCEETFRMSGLNFEFYKKLALEKKKPRLYQWFDVENKKDTIGIWPFAAYGKNCGRNPSFEWWNEVVKELKKDYKIIHFGHFSEPKLNNEDINLTNLSLFDQIKIAIGCKLNINTDSGSGWLIGAYGVPQISLLSMAGLPYATRNIYCLAPENYNNNSINLFGNHNCDSITKEEIIDSIKKLT